MTPTLTLNLGVRYDLFTPYSEDDGLQANFVPNGGNDRAGRITFPRPPAAIPVIRAFKTLLATDGIKTVAFRAGIQVPTGRRTRSPHRDRQAHHIEDHAAYWIWHYLQSAR